MAKKKSKHFIMRHIVPITLGLVVVGLTLMILSTSDKLVGGPFSFRLFHGAPARTQVKHRVYANSEYGVQFSYPTYYELTERSGTKDGEPTRTVTLITKGDAAAQADVVAGEGPRSIVIELSGAGDAKTSLDLAEADPNFKLATKNAVELMLQGVKGAKYSWSGLYEGETIAFVTGGRAVGVTATYINQSDPTLKDMRGVILPSLRFTEPTVSPSAEAVAAVKAKYPEFKNYPSDNLPPTTIGSDTNGVDWYLAFEARGSGRPGVIKATCFKVTPSGTVTKTGEFAAGATTVASISPRTCEAPDADQVEASE